MYIGVWQEYRLAQAVGGRRPGGQSQSQSQSQPQPQPQRPRIKGGSEGDRTSAGRSGQQQHQQQAHLRGDEEQARWKADDDDNDAAVDALLTRLHDGSQPEKEVLTEFLQSFSAKAAAAQQKQQQQQQLQQQLPGGLPSLDPFRTTLKDEQDRQRRQVQARREAGPLKLQAIQRRRDDFFSNLQQQQNKQEEEEEEELSAKAKAEEEQADVQSDADGVDDEDDERGSTLTTSSAPPSILPTRPSLLFQSFLPADRSAKAEPLIPQPKALRQVQLHGLEAPPRLVEQEPAPLQGAAAAATALVPCIGNVGIKTPGEAEEADIDDLLSWTKSLGMDDDDEFLFEDD